MEGNTEKELKLAKDQLKLSLETTQEFVDMWTNNYQSTIGKLAQMPAFGPVREKQEKMMKSMPIYSKLYAAWIDSNTNLHSVLLEAMRKTFEKTVEYQINSKGCTKDGKSYMDPEKYKEFYKIWIDAYSETFKDFMKSEHYSSDMAKFASVFIDFQTHNREMIEDNYLKPNNLPTKTDIEEIHKELYGLRKTVKDLIGNIKELCNKEEHAKKVELQNKEEDSKKAELYIEEEKVRQVELRDLKKTVKNLTEDIKDLRSKEEQAKKVEWQNMEEQVKKEDLHNEDDKVRQVELRDLKKTVKDLTEDIKGLRSKEEQAKKVELQNREVQINKADLSTKKEVHTK